MSTPIKTCFAMLLLLGGACAEESDDPSSISPAVTAFAAGGAAPPPVLPPQNTLPAQTASTPPATTTPASSSTLIVENRFASQSVWGVYLSPSNDDDWGPEQLGGKILLPGEDLTLRRIPCNLYYDLKITGAGSSTIATVNGIPFACGIEKVVTLGR
jgi:hypothetical protein